MKKETENKNVESKETELVVYKEKIKGMKEMVEETKVIDEKTAGEVSDKVKNIKMLSKAIEQKRDKILKPASEIVKEARLTYNPLIQECEYAERALKGKYSEWFLAEEKRVAAEELKVAKKVESGYIKPETAVKKMEEINVTDNTIKGKDSMLSVKKVPVAVIKDITNIPDEFWIVDESAVKKAALLRHKQGMPQIPGVEVEMRIDTSSR